MIDKKKEDTSNLLIKKKQERRQEAPDQDQDWKKLQDKKKMNKIITIQEEEEALAYLPVPGPEAGPVLEMGTEAGSCSALEDSSPGSSSGLSEESLILIVKVQGDKALGVIANLLITVHYMPRVPARLVPHTILYGPYRQLSKARGEGRRQARNWCKL